MSAVFNCEDMLEHLSSYFFLFGLGSLRSPGEHVLIPGLLLFLLCPSTMKGFLLCGIGLLEKTYLAVALAFSFCDI